MHAPVVHGEHTMPSSLAEVMQRHRDELVRMVMDSAG